VSDVVHCFDLWTRRRRTMTMDSIQGSSRSSPATMENELVGMDPTTGLRVFVGPDTILLAPQQRSFDDFPNFAPPSVFSYCGILCRDRRLDSYSVQSRSTSRVPNPPPNHPCRAFESLCRVERSSTQMLSRSCVFEQLFLKEQVLSM
jgi:hypothetical protein